MKVKLNKTETNMAIRNLEAINRKVDEVAKRREQRIEGFKKAVDAFRKHHQDAVDAADTILAIHDKGLNHHYDIWYNTNEYSWDFRESLDNEVKFYVKIDYLWSDDKRKVIFVAKEECTNDKPWEIEYSPVKNKVYLRCWRWPYDLNLDDDGTLGEIEDEIEDFTTVFKVMEKGLSVFCKTFFEWADRGFGL